MINEQNFRLNKKTGEPLKNVTFCKHPELIENYDKAIADETQTWEVHHRREELYSRAELIERGEYYDRPPEELIFLTPTEHRKMDSMSKRNAEAHKGKKHSEETKRKMSEARKGKFINRKDQSKKVLCVETGEVFDSTREAERKTGASYGKISRVCRGERKTTGGFHWKFV